MAEVVQMFLFLYKSKYRRKASARASAVALVCTLLVLASAANAYSNLAEPSCDFDSCVNGACVNDSCLCHEGWQGPACQYCGGKIRLTEPSGTIFDGFGNYTSDVKCSWLIETSPNSTIRLHIEEFATECGWDHLYIYDGDSVEAPLLAVFTGIMYKNGYHIRRVPEVVARSGSAFLHFYSDVAYNMSGFNITYRINACPSRTSSEDCSGHGECLNGVCSCDSMWTGEACDMQECPHDCYSNRGHGTCNVVYDVHRCDCTDNYIGPDCNQKIDHGFWLKKTYESEQPAGSASHCTVVWKDSMYVIGGESFSGDKRIYRYDYNGNVWETSLVNGKVPSPRYAHSCALFGDKIFMYGGVTSDSMATSELWSFDITTNVWENVTVDSRCNNRTMCGPLKVAGHTATLVRLNSSKKEKMVVIFGHSTQYGYLDAVQEYYFDTREWQVVETRGFPVKGGFGHSAAYDYLTNLIYVYGGLASESYGTQVLTSRLYSYQPLERIWRQLSEAPSPRFFHTGVFVSAGLMLVFGGNTHNDTLLSHGALCYSADTIVYDAVCDTWRDFPMPADLVDLPRYGHSATLFGRSIYIFGGFNGQMLSDMLQYTPGNCANITDQSHCLNAKIGVKCIWNRRDKRCVALMPHHYTHHDSIHESQDENYARCPANPSPRNLTHHEELCKPLTNCTSCVQTSYGCVWCGKFCSYQKCREGSYMSPVRHLQQCETPHRGSECVNLHTCNACANNPHCTWSSSNSNFMCKARPRIRDGNSTSLQKRIVESCGSPCAEITSCYNCTANDCIWCQNAGKCVDKNAYPASFPYGQCWEWTTSHDRCRPTDAFREWCSFHLSCSSCRNEPSCGWCDDGSGTGKGKCMPGGAKKVSPHAIESCPADRWYFTDCPLCQCNGHSRCRHNSSECLQPCADLTHGKHCENCNPGYYGSPLNGATCQPCSCNDQGTQCTSETGKCFCTTKGIIGDHCEKCDVTGLYHGDPTNKGSCFYDLAIDYQFTFNLSKKEDRHYRAINFKNSPPKPDVDADFTITCSVLAKMNITIKKANSPERPLLTGANCTTYKHRFLKADYNFGNEDNNTLTTFFVYVYDFQPPLWIQISFSQYSKLNLQQFFITFSTDYLTPHRCFLALLLVAAVLWKIKQKYDMYRRRQRLYVEMEQMANRAFSQVLVEIERRDLTSDSDSETNSARKKKKDAPSPIALEPCCGNKAAVLSLLVRLPTGGMPYTPEGHSAGLAVASALVTLGSPRRPSQELTIKEPKKARKSTNQHPDATCI